MSSFIFENNKIINFQDYCLSESIKPKEINFGTNKTFDNNDIIKIQNILLTSFEYKEKIYTVIIHDEDVGFHTINKKEIDFENFNYLEDMQNKSIELSGSNAVSIFSFVFFIIQVMIKKFNLQKITFNAENKKLDKMYNNLVNNKFFINEFEKIGFKLKIDKDKFIFSKE